MKKQDAAKIYSLLCKQYPDARDSPAMLSKGPAFEVLILTILSAQTTDRAVLQVKKPLLTRYPNPSALAKAKQEDVETIIHSLGYFHAKARHIIAASQALESEYDGRVPETMEAAPEDPRSWQENCKHRALPCTWQKRWYRGGYPRPSACATDRIFRYGQCEYNRAGSDGCVSAGAMGRSYGCPDCAWQIDLRRQETEMRNLSD